MLFGFKCKHDIKSLSFLNRIHKTLRHKNFDIWCGNCDVTRAHPLGTNKLGERVTYSFYTNNVDTGSILNAIF